MSLIIKSGNGTTDELTVDAVSKAMRNTLYNSLGQEILNRPTYSAGVITWTPPATPSDMMIITNPSSKIVKIMSIILSGTQTTAGVNTFIFIKRTSLNTAGTFVGWTAFEHDTNDNAPTVVAGHYTANPSGLGTQAGILKVIRMLCPAPAGTVDNAFHYEEGKNLLMKPITLRNANQQLCLNFNGTALPAGLTLSASVTWTEE